MLRIAREPIDPKSVEARAHSENCGGVVTFLGIVRARADDGRSVDGLHYEAFDEMAVAEFEAITAEARERFGNVRIAAEHRVGDLKVGDVAVVVCVAAEHRGEAFAACRYAIDELKRRAPIWKKEHYVDGGGEWKANAARVT
ncbi:MAG TPA: molybdenum cofactor biosynthesis protein MoaE [Candidatus Baltobacteraceae bacterium]|nr:molybdenum cofactor biosynthesis protein MoaE [Candidatus Baltobacteraceae bacterium]